MPLSAADKEAIRAYVDQGTSPEDKRTRRRECQEIYGVSLPTIAAITAHTVIRRNRANGVYATRKTSTPATITQPVPAQPTDRGATFDYNNPAKRAWRSTVMSFIDKHTPPVGRENLRVLHLCGLEGHETDALLNLGFSPKNLHGVEISTKHPAKLQAIRDRTGAQIHNGDIAEHLTQRGPWDVISLDHTGPINEDRLRELDQIQYAHNVVLVTNFLAGREQARAQTHLMKFVKLVKLQSKSSRTYDLDEISLNDEETLDRAQFSRLVWAHAAKTMKEGFDIVLGTGTYLPEIILKKVYFGTIPYLNEHPRAYGPLISNMLHSASMPIYVAKEHAATEYQSPSRQNYYTDMFAATYLSCPNTELKQFIETLTAATATMPPTTKFTLSARDKHASPRPCGAPLQLSDEIEVRVNGKRAASVRIRALSKGLLRYLQTTVDDFLTLSTMDVERKAIEVLEDLQ